MIELYIRDRDCETAKVYRRVVGLHSRLFDAINAIPKASPDECAVHLETAIHVVEELTRLRESDIPSADVNDFADQTRLALQSLAQKRLEITEATDQNSEGLWALASAAKTPADRLCDCLVGLTKERENRLRQMILEKDKEMAARHEEEPTRSLLSRLMFWKRPED